MQFTTIENAWIKPFIDSAHFQRLRHIKQLGLGDFIFPGAAHSRFNHCLGCCYVACQIAQKIGLAEEERHLVMIACLLHDIGHGPFSHTFEGIFTDNLIHHEDWTPYFLADYDADFFARYNKLNPRHHLTPEKFQHVADMIMHKPMAKNVMADIVSSQLDADRLDYLLRDSHFCGVSYGEFDFRWMLNCMTIVATPAGERLGITHKGIGVVEHYLMARRLMLRNIYHSQKKIAFEQLLVQLLAILAESLTESLFASLTQTRLGQFLMAVNQYNQTVSIATNKQVIKQAFLEDNFKNYKELCDYDVFTVIKQVADIPSDHAAVQLAKRIQARQMPKIVRLDHANLTAIRHELATFKQQHRAYQDWQLSLMKTPHQSYSEEDPIWVVNEWGVINPIGKFSFMLNAISDKLEHIAFLAVDKTIANDAPIIHLMQQLQASPVLM